MSVRAEWEGYLQYTSDARLPTRQAVVKSARHTGTNTAWFYLQEAPRMVQLMRYEADLWLPGGWREEGKGRLSLEKMKTFRTGW